MYKGAFQLNKVRRLIITQGRLFTFVTEGKNDFGEPNGETVSQNLKGVFHETTSYVSKETSSASTTRKKSSPMVLTLWESVKEINKSYQVQLNGKTYQVNEVKNLCESNLLADISLEEVQH